MNGADRISEIEIKRDKNEAIQTVRFTFGPHYFVEVVRENGRVMFHVGATHHGIRADASEVNGELERFVEVLKRANPGNAF